jgi:hypothetical protein
MRLLGRAPLLVAVWVFAAATIARADTAPVVRDKAEARDAYNEGRHYVDLKDYSHAVVSFKRAFLAFEDPLLLFNIAQCYRLLGDKEQAAHYYRVFLGRVPEPSNLAEIQAWLSRLDADIEAERTEHAARPQPQGVEPLPRGADDGPSEPTPVYRKWWLWTIVGVAVVGVSLGVGLGVGLRGPPVFHSTEMQFGPGITTTSATIAGFHF